MHRVHFESGVRMGIGTFNLVSHYLIFISINLI